LPIGVEGNGLYSKNGVKTVCGRISDLEADPKATTPDGGIYDTCKSPGRYQTTWTYAAPDRPAQRRRFEALNRRAEGSPAPQIQREWNSAQDPLRAEKSRENSEARPEFAMEYVDARTRSPSWNPPNPCLRDPRSRLPKRTNVSKKDAQ